MGSGASSKASRSLEAKYPEIVSEAGGSHDFYFIRAEKLQEFDTQKGPIPCHQELLGQEGWLIKKQVFFYTLLKGGYTDMAMISHRWMTPRHPDPQSEQIEKIKEFLQDNPQVKLVWLDYVCIPQGRRDENQERYFRECLNHVSLLFISLPVMIIYDKQYASRFWCNYEMYLCLRSASVEGIGPANDEELQTRFHFYCVGSAQKAYDKYKAVELTNWRDLTVSEAAEMLKEEDIMVTNRRDKDVQLEQLAGLELCIRDILVVKEAELRGKTKPLLAKLVQVQSVAHRLPAVESEAAELKKIEDEARKALEQAEKAAKDKELEMADMKELLVDFPERHELDEEVKALETFLHADQAEARKEAAQNAAVLSISGATGPNACIINGVWNLVEEPYNNMPMWQKKEDRSKWLFQGSDEQWWISNEKHKSTFECAGWVHLIGAPRSELPTSKNWKFKVANPPVWEEQDIRIRGRRLEE